MNWWQDQHGLLRVPPQQILTKPHPDLIPEHFLEYLITRDLSGTLLKIWNKFSCDTSKHLISRWVVSQEFGFKCYGGPTYASEYYKYI